jgi:hypothetical protein
VDLRGRGPKLAFAAACLTMSVSAGIAASAYTTAGMDPFYLQQRDRAESLDAPADSAREIAYTAPIDLSPPDRGYRPDGEPSAGSSFPPIPTSR